jgi:hypothetical protein
MEMPEDVRRNMGFALRFAQAGIKHDHAKPLKGFKGAGVLEVVEDYDGDTYRAVYTVTRSPKQRRRIMQSVKTANTGPEMTVRRLLHSMGYRYRIHAKELPGKPDIVFRPQKKAIFVHGCFWHGHDCKTGRAPKAP